MSNLKISPLLAVTLALLYAPLTVTPEIFSVSSAYAADPSDMRGDWERYEQCKRLRATGDVNWYAIASGTVNFAGGRADRGAFHVKVCLETEQQCQAWLRNIWHEIPHLDEIHAAYCSPAH